MPNRSLIDLYDTTTWYWDSRFYWWIYRHSYLTLFARLLRRAWIERSTAPLRVLDCGIGTGLLTWSLITALDRPSDVYGVDTSQAMLERARGRIRSVRTQPRLVRADISKLPFRDRQMDFVMSALVLEHAPAPLAALREMVRVARANAPILLIATRVGAPDWPFRMWFRYRPFSHEQVVQWMREAGISDVVAESLSGRGWPFARAYLGSVSPA